MWESNTKNIIKKIILAILCLALIAGLVYGILLVRSQEEKQDAELMAVYSQQQAEQQEARQAELRGVEEAYSRDLEVLSQYLPGIVCVGDELTGGTSGGVSYPAVLQELVNVNLCDAYDFRSTIKNADDYNNRLNWKDYTVNVPVVNLGTGEESADTILGRIGAVPYVTASALEIPADSTPVQIFLKSENGAEVKPLLGSDIGVNDVTVAGVKGHLSVSTPAYWATEYYFTRSEPGEAVSVEPGEPVFTAAAGQYSGYIPVIFVGSFGGYTTRDELVAKIEQIRDFYVGPDGRYLVIGNYYSKDNYGNGGLGSAVANEATENLMQQTFGEHYINFRKYLANDGLTDAEMQPTKEDTRRMKSGIVPDSLLNNENRIELIPVGYTLLGQLVYDRFVQLGYFNEVVTELQIENFGR